MYCVACRHLVPALTESCHKSKSLYPEPFKTFPRNLKIRLGLFIGLILHCRALFRNLWTPIGDSSATFTFPPDDGCPIIKLFFFADVPPSNPCASGVTDYPHIRLNVPNMYRLLYIDYFVTSTLYFLIDLNGNNEPIVRFNTFLNVRQSLVDV